MNATLHFKRNDFYPVSKRDFVVDVQVGDLAHAVRKVRATCIHNKCQFCGVIPAYLPHAWITLDGRTHQVYINPRGEAEVKDVTDTVVV